MDLKERSPSFVEMKVPKQISDKKSISISQKMIFKPMTTTQILQSLNMYSPMDQAPSAKKLNMKPVRTAELNLDEFITKSPKITRNVRKQLWSVQKADNKWTGEKVDKFRRTTVMKPGKDNLRKSVYSRPSMIQQKKSRKQSMDDTLPLMDMEQLTVTKIKKTLFSAPQSKLSNQRKTTSHINANKLPFVSSLAKRISKPIPSIVVTPVQEKTVKTSINKKTSDNKQKTVNEIKEDKIDLVFDKLLSIEDKINSFDDIKALLCSICLRLGIDLPVNFSSKDKGQTQKSEEIEQIFATNENKTKLLSSCFKGEVSSMPTIKENVNSSEFKEKIYKLSPFMIKQKTNLTNEENSTELKLSPCTSKITNNHEEIDTEFIKSTKLTNNQLEKIEKDTFTESKTMFTSKVPTNNQSEIEKNDTFTNFKLSFWASKISNNQNDTESKSNENEKPVIINNNKNSDDKVVESVENLQNIPPSTPNNTRKLEDIFTPKTDTTNTKTESTIKLKKTWITQFEQLENKLLNNSNVSINLNSSPDDSPVQPLQIDKIVNDDDTYRLTLKKSQSTSNLLEGNTSHQKNIHFKSRDTDFLTESICVYNELRDELPKFLSTPVNKTNKTMSFITPSVQGNEKKLISRRVQEQLLRLNDI